MIKTRNNAYFIMEKCSHNLEYHIKLREGRISENEAMYILKNIL